MSKVNRSLGLNNIKPATGAKTVRKRVGRGDGSGVGKTCGRGHKGQKSRSGGYHKIGFEGGQMPLQRRLPKIGFHARKSALSAEVRLGELEKLETALVDQAALVKAGLIPACTRRVKVFLSGKIVKPITLKGIAASAGARRAIERAGGKVEA